MSRLSLLGLATIALTFAIGSLNAQESAEPAVAVPATRAGNERSCKVYDLSDLGDDGALAAWVADNLPVLVTPGSWPAGGGHSYFAPRRLLVVNHTRAAHAELDQLLGQLRRTVTAARPMPRVNDTVVPAVATDPVPISTNEPPTAAPCPERIAPPQQTSKDYDESADLTPLGAADPLRRHFPSLVTDFDKQCSDKSVARGTRPQQASWSDESVPLKVRQRKVAWWEPRYTEPLAVEPYATAKWLTDDLPPLEMTASELPFYYFQGYGHSDGGVRGFTFSVGAYR